MYKVLIADDERMVRLTLRTLIEREAEGFTVLAEAKDGEQAYRISLEARPDVIITDIRMPGLTGLELIRSLSAHKLEPEYLVVSGHDDFGYAQAAIRSGVADYLLKPIDPAYFSHALGRIAARLNSKSGRRPSRDWMWTWKGYAEQAAEAIWGLTKPILRPRRPASALTWRLKATVPKPFQTSGSITTGSC
ncbi:response regulator [Paenibacillus sp. CC-CFT747]|nr:response regulator [Paenibacillus sp. CC-CFT747]